MKSFLVSEHSEMDKADGKPEKSEMTMLLQYFVLLCTPVCYLCVDITLLQRDTTVEQGRFQVFKNKLIHLPIWIAWMPFKYILLIFLLLKTGSANLEGK